MAKAKKVLSKAKQAVALKAQGLKTNEIAEKLGTSASYVYSATAKKLAGKGKRTYKRRGPTSDASAQLDVISAINSVKSIADEQRLEMIRKIVG